MKREKLFFLFCFLFLLIGCESLESVSDGFFSFFFFFFLFLSFFVSFFGMKTKKNRDRKEKDVLFGLEQSSFFFQTICISRTSPRSLYFFFSFFFSLFFFFAFRCFSFLIFLFLLSLSLSLSLSLFFFFLFLFLLAFIDENAQLCDVTKQNLAPIVNTKFLF